LRKFLLFLIISSFSSSSFSQEVELAPIKIEKDYWQKFMEVQDYIYREEIPLFSLEEMIDYSSSIDLKKRSIFGIQQDISLRGSIFEDVSVKLAGVKINDPQTGHFNLEIPLTSADIEEIEIHKNAQTINFNLLPPKDKGAFCKISFGQHALWEKLISLNFLLGESKNRVSFEHKISSGYRQDTDFEIYNFSFHSLWEEEDKEVEFLFGSTKRDFGAGNFYTTLFPHQEEHITQRFFYLRTKIPRDFLKLNNILYLRRHTDKFILDRHNPAFYTNYHTTYIYGFNTKFDFTRSIFLDLDIRREEIDSTNLGKHHRLNMGCRLGVEKKRIGNFIFDFQGGVNYYEDWEYLEEVQLNLGYFLKENLKLGFSCARVWRTPSFTELYYFSPANVGNPDLEIQKSNNFEVGLESIFEDIIFSGKSFLRSQSHTIDWVRNSLEDPWQAENIGDLQIWGV